MSATAAASAMADGILSVLPDADIDRCPIGDGGEGTLAVLLESGSGQLLKSQVAGPLGEMVDASIGMLGDGQVAFVESATAIGLPLIPADRRDVMRTTSYGVGELLLDAISKQPAQIIVGVGGSATNDGGCGMAQALGVSERTLRKWMRDGGLPYLRRDGIVLIPRAELEDWLRDQVGSSSDTDELAREILRDL